MRSAFVLIFIARAALAMGPHHVERIEALGGGGKVHLLSAYASRGANTQPISDPMGADLEIYRATVDELERDVRAVIDRLIAEGALDGPAA